MKQLITPEYKAAIIDLHSKYVWGIGAGKYVGDSIVAVLKQHPEIKTILDYGCGEGTLKDRVEDDGITDKIWTLYDPGMPKFDSVPTGKFDLVITTDVLEHVEEIMLNNVLDHLRDLTGRFLYNEIACYSTNRTFFSGPYIGQDLHINLKAPDMWKQRLLHRDFEVREFTVSLIEGWKVRFLSIQERSNSE